MMKREELLALGLNSEQVKSVLRLYGRDVERYKTSQAEDAKRRRELEAKLKHSEAESARLSDSDADSLRRETERWREAAESARKELGDYKVQVALEHVLEKSAAKNRRAVAALLDLTAAQDSGNLEENLMKQAQALQKEQGFLFEQTDYPVVVRPVQEEAPESGFGFFSGARRGAGLA